MNRILLVFLFAFLALADHIAFGQAQIVGGLLDLRHMDFKEKTVQLSGKSHFEWRSFVEPGVPAKTSHLIGIPELWEGQILGDDTISNLGYASYQFTILINEDLVQERKALALGMVDLYCSYTLYIDDLEIGSNGIVARNKENYKPYWKPQVLSFIPENDTLLLTLHVANFSHIKGGIRKAMEFGGKDRITHIYTSDLSYDFILTGCLLMGGLFFLGLYFFGRNEYSMLLFALFCLSYSYRFIGAKNYAFHHLFDNIPWILTIKLEYFSLFVSAGLFAAYSFYLYPKETSSRVTIAFVGFCGILSLITIAFPPIVFTGLLRPFFFTLLFTMPYLLYTYFLAARNRRDGAVISVISTMALFLSFSYDILAYLGFFAENNVIIFCSYLSFFFLQSLILSYRFAQSLKKAINRAEEAALAKSNFLSTMSHEIRTPLNAVIGFTNLLKVGKSQQENLESLKFSSKSLLQLINDILDYAKIDAGIVDFEYRQTDIDKLIGQLMQSHRTVAKQKSKLQFFSEVDNSIPKSFLCDQVRLGQVLNNLISNAIKFTSKGYVNVIVKKLDQTDTKLTLLFAVEDTGIGIAKENHDYIFEAFTQASTSTNRKFGGTGLGLSICKKLLALQDVQIKVESEVGRGSTFSFEQTFVLPPKQPSSNGVRHTSSSSVEKDLLVNKRILLVEDNLMNIMVAKKYLEKWKASIDVAETGFEALEKFDNHDLILMDLQIPEMDGFDTCEKLRSMGIDVPIIALTASALLDVKQRVLTTGMDDYITKPFDPEDLYQKIATHLKKKVA